MDAEYFKDQIYDELNGAKCYIKKAIEIKPMSPSWSKMLVEMSAAELKHADYLYKMYTEYYQQMKNTYKEIPTYLKEIHETITNMYLEYTATVKLMHDMVNQ